MDRVDSHAQPVFAAAMADLSAAAQLFITGLPRGGIHPGFEEFLRTTPPAGLLLFRHDFQSTEELQALVNRLRDLCWPHEPLLCMDEEGGLVSQLAPELEVAPSARVMGRAASAEECLSLGCETGRLLRQLGVQIDFAPVYDVDVEASNPVIGPRAFSSQPEVVASKANAFADGLHRAGVLSCAKHFPGHGDTQLDSHLSLPVCRATRTEMEETHLAPFRSAIANDIPLVMVSHVAYPTHDDDKTPATLSKPIITSLLREKMGYHGVVVTDAMEMKAVSDLFSWANAACRSLEAGADILLYGRFDEQVESAIRAVGDAMDSGRISQQQIEQTTRRLAQLRTRLAGLRDAPGARGIKPVDRESLFHRALRWVGPELKPRPQKGRRTPWLVVEPTWAGGPTVAGLLSDHGIEVAAHAWGDATPASWERAEYLLVASRHRTRLTDQELRWLSWACQEQPTWVIAFAQDALLKQVPAATGRLSACDPSPVMRKVAVDTLLSDL